MKRVFYFVSIVVLLLSCKEDVVTKVTQAFSNGKTKTECDFTQNGQVKVHQRTYQENGNMFFEGPIVNDKREGEWLFYDYEGRLKSKRVYKEGEYHGAYIEYDENGEVTIEGEYENGKRSGDWKNENDSSKKVKESKGNLKENKNDKGTIEITEKYEGGEKKTEKLYSDDSKTILSEKHYYNSGELLMAGNMEDNKRSGKWESYFKNGKIQSINYYLEGLIHGDYIVYMENGGIMIEGEYDMGKQTGTWNSYDDNGKLINNKFYNQNGELLEETNY